MNRSTKLRNFFKLQMLLVTACLFAGCIHFNERSAEIHGRVLDAKTRLPIEGARIAFDEKPSHPAYTDAAGRFHLKARHTFHLGGNAAGGSWPSPKSGSKSISHTNYVTVFGYSSSSGDVGDILLQPNSPFAH